MGNIKKIKSVNNLLSAMRLNGDPVKTTKDGTDEYIIGGDYKKKTDGSKFIGESTSKIKKDTKGVKYVSMLDYGENLPKGDTIHLRNISPLKQKEGDEKAKKVAEDIIQAKWEKQQKERAKKKKLAADAKKKKEAEENKLEKVETKGPAEITKTKTKTKYTGVNKPHEKGETVGNQRIQEAVDRANADDSLLTGKDKRKAKRAEKKQVEADRIAGMSDEELAAEKELKSAKKNKWAKIIGAGLSAAGGGKYWDDDSAKGLKDSIKKVKDLKAAQGDVDETSSDAAIEEANEEKNDVIGGLPTVVDISAGAGLFTGTTKEESKTSSPAKRKRKKKKKSEPRTPPIHPSRQPVYKDGKIIGSTSFKK